MARCYGGAADPGQIVSNLTTAARLAAGDGRNSAQLASEARLLAQRVSTSGYGAGAAAPWVAGTAVRFPRAAAGGETLYAQVDTLVVTAPFVSSHAATAQILADQMVATVETVTGATVTSDVPSALIVTLLEGAWLSSCGIITATGGIVPGWVSAEGQVQVAATWPRALLSNEDLSLYMNGGETLVPYRGSSEGTYAAMIGALIAQPGLVRTAMLTPDGHTAIITPRDSTSVEFKSATIKLVGVTQATGTVVDCPPNTNAGFPKRIRPRPAGPINSYSEGIRNRLFLKYIGVDYPFYNQGDMIFRKGA